MNTYKTTKMRVAAAGLVVAVFGMSGCGDFMEVTNAGLIEDEALNDPSFAGAVVAGMSADYSRALNPGLAQFATVMAFEMTGGTSDQGEHIIGYLDGNIVDRQTTWDGWQRARWVASAGVTRLGESLTDYSSNKLAGQANLYAGLSNRLLGEMACHSVIDGGGANPREAHWPIAESYFTQAITIATAAGDDDTKHAALGGRASVRAWQGNWSGAEADAALVPGEFVWSALYSSSGVNLRMYDEQYTSRYITMQGNPGGWNDHYDANGDDPRVPWSKTKLHDDSGTPPPTRGGGWRTWPQTKYNERGSDVPQVHGAEMLVLRAESALRSGDIAGMTTLLNESRALARWGGGLAALAQPADEAAAWTLLKRERLATIWLEHRGFYDLSRWNAEGKDSSLAGRATCFPIGQKEIDSNPNLESLR